MKTAGSMILAMLFAFSLWLGPAPAARAETFNCTTINTLPTVISTPGNYCLNKNFSQDFANTAIYIDSDDVVLDCNHHAIIHSNPAGTVNGIQVESHSNVTVRNCNTSGFYVAIYFPEFSDKGSQNNRILNNTITKSRYTSMIINGSNNLIEGNKISNMLADYNSNTTSSGIQLYSYNAHGTGNVIRDNVIADFKPFFADVSIYGIHFFYVTNTTITNNTIQGLTARTGYGIYGIVGERTIGSSVIGNSVLSAVSPAAPYDGVNYGGILMWYDNVGDDLKSVCTDNTIGHFDNDISGCVVAGNTTF